MLFEWLLLLLFCYSRNPNHPSRRSRPSSSSNFTHLSGLEKQTFTFSDLLQPLRAVTEHRDTHDFGIQPCPRIGLQNEWLALVLFPGCKSIPLLVTKTGHLPFLGSCAVSLVSILLRDEKSLVSFSNHVWLCSLEARMSSHLSFLRVLLHSQAQITSVGVGRFLKTQGKGLKHLFICP